MAEYGRFGAAACVVAVIAFVGFLIATAVDSTGRASWGWRGTLNEQLFLAIVISGGLAGLVAGARFVHIRGWLRAVLVGMWLLNIIALSVIVNWLGAAFSSGAGGIPDKVPAEWLAAPGLGFGLALTTFALSSLLEGRARSVALVVMVGGMIALPVYCHLHGDAYLSTIERKICPTVARFFTQNLLTTQAQPGPGHARWYGVGFEGTHSYVSATMRIRESSFELRLIPVRRMTGPAGERIKVQLYVPLGRDLASVPISTAEDMQRLLVRAGIRPAAASLFTQPGSIPQAAPPVLRGDFAGIPVNAGRSRDERRPHLLLYFEGTWADGTLRPVSG